jgi:hypothetical protein
MLKDACRQCVPVAAAMLLAELTPLGMLVLNDVVRHGQCTGDVIEV